MAMAVSNLPATEITHTTNNANADNVVGSEIEWPNDEGPTQKQTHT